MLDIWDHADPSKQSIKLVKISGFLHVIWADIDPLSDKGNDFSIKEKMGDGTLFRSMLTPI
jgi:hypothetical protein